MQITGREIKAKRSALDWTQQDLSDHIKVSTRTIQRWEDGDVIPDNMQVLLYLLFKSEEKGDTMSVTQQRIVYLNKDELDLNKEIQIVIKVV